MARAECSQVHAETKHTEKDNAILFPGAGDRLGCAVDTIQTREPLGGHLRSHHEKAHDSRWPSGMFARGPDQLATFTKATASAITLPSVFAVESVTLCRTPALNR